MELPAGKYYLSEVISTSNKKIKGKIDKNKNSTLAEFEVKQGEVIYLGDLTIKMRSKAFKKDQICIIVKDTFSDASSYFMSRPLILQDTLLQKRLLTIRSETGVDQCSFS